GDPTARARRQSSRGISGSDRIAVAAVSFVKEYGVGKPSAKEPMLDPHEIQATVLRHRPAPYFGAHVLLRVDDARAGRELLRRLMPHVDSAESWWNAANPSIFVGISYAG